jgi:hypothetical protein
MAIAKGKTNAGQGGKRGHSNMDHWDFTEAIKAAARKDRRLKAKVEIKEGLADFHDKSQPGENRLSEHSKHNLQIERD